MNRNGYEAALAARSNAAPARSPRLLAVVNTLPAASRAGAVEPGVAPLAHLPRSAGAEAGSVEALLAAAHAADGWRRRREAFFPPKLIGEPAWSMLLDLYINALENRMVSTTSLSRASAAPLTTALRWINYFERLSISKKVKCPKDRRVTYQVITDFGMNLMNGYFSKENNGMAEN